MQSIGIVDYMLNMHFFEELPNLSCIKASLFLSFYNFKNIYHYTKLYSCITEKRTLK